MSEQDRVAMVTGAGRGIGAAVAQVLAGSGYRVAVCDLDGAAAQLVADDLGARFGVKTVAVAADIASDDTVRAALDQITAALGPVEILINNAAIDVIELFVDSDPATWDRIIGVNLRGTIGVTRAVLDGMIAQQFGRIIHIASDAGRVGSSGEVVYSATKGGVIAFGKALAREVARHGITVNSVCPGPTDTALLGQVAEYSQRIVDATVKAIPLRRIAVPDDIAGVVGFLTSDAASYMTGQTISVSGGLTML
ncbi:SDR family oxidoreductase [Nocardia vinacea]|uniref:3-oxoacyl-[acyl-carrier-protein] reductase MabA n=1 Tax=Nocardia vinacea TaxID=96468 RepID=A0ABZ1YRH9_9NOCA|nr:SDR family oxidoreductase [Nocardia vinacea]